MSRLSRRGMLKGALGLGAAAAGARVAGPLIGDAFAQGTKETSHFVHIFYHGGLNAAFTGCAKILQGNFRELSADRIMPVTAGSQVFTDAATWGTLPQFAREHWAAIGFQHGSGLHTVPENRNGGGEMGVIRNGSNNYLTQLAAAMGGTSPYKAVLLGGRSQDYGVFADWPAVSNVRLQRLSNLRNTLQQVGAEKVDNGPVTDRGHLAATLEAAQDISARQIATNPDRLSYMDSSYDAAVASLRQPPPPPVTFDEVNKAYGLGGRTDIGRVGSGPAFAAQFAMAEILIRAANTNVIHITDFEPMWDFDSPGNYTSSRNRFLGSGSYNRLAPMKTFLERMLNFPGKNVVVAVSGEFVRQVTSDHGHGDGVVAAVFGKNIKQGMMNPVNNMARFPGGTPKTAAFWAGIAAACKVPGQPFGGNPYASLLG